MKNDNFANLDFSLSLFEAMQKDNLSYIYRGYFNQQITDSILSLTELNLETKEQSSKMKKRVYAILVEGLQNITRHQTDAKVDESHKEFDTNGLFVIKRNNDKYYITTGNATNKKNIPTITKLIEKINSLDKDELKKYYKEVLNEGELSDKGGAGLGLIDMARKSGNKLSYKFVDLSDEDTYFYLHTIPTLEQQEDFEKIAQASLDNIIEIHKTLNKEDIRLIYNGTLSQDSLMGILSTIEGHMEGTPDKKNKMFNIVLEMLQNIVKHGKSPKEEAENNGNPGIFFISKKGDKYLLTAGNYISDENTQKLKTKIEQVNNLSDSELDEYYNQSLLDFENDDSKKSGLGIIDLRVKSNNKIGYYFKNIDKNTAFFSIQVKI